MQIPFKKLHPDAMKPKYETRGSAGFDLHALEDVVILPGETKLIKTGLSFEIPSNYVLDIRPRSGMSLKTKMRIANSPGTIDSDYRGEVCIVAENTESNKHAIFNFVPSQSIKIKKGDRIAQGVLVAIAQGEFELKEELSETERGDGGFGSTGGN